MSKQRPTFAKLQREREKREKQQLKAERRAMRSEESPDDALDAAPAGPVDQAKVLAALDALHKDFEEERINREDFEARRDDLLVQLQID